MLFASFPFILVYLPIIIVACIALQRLIGPKAAQAWILVASVFFYATSKPFNLVLIFASILLGIGFQTMLTAFLADLLAVNRRLMEDVQYRVKKLEFPGADDHRPGGRKNQ